MIKSQYGEDKIHFVSSIACFGFIPLAYHSSFS